MEWAVDLSILAEIIRASGFFRGNAGQKVNNFIQWVEEVRWTEKTEEERVSGWLKQVEKKRLSASAFDRKDAQIY